ncbi:MAG: 4Fe-4S binding protein [Akkermansia sp.]|nr:4Fe-4S binding protein [Akkermansia sp.]
MNTWITATFSPTGSTRAISQAIAAGKEQQHIDLLKPTEAQLIPATTPLLAVVPVYGGRVPAIAIERLSALQGEGGPAIAVVVYGNRAYEDALLELKNTLTGCGFRVVAAAAFIAEHSIARSIATGRPHEQDKQTAAAFSVAIDAKLALPLAEQAEVSVPGNEDMKPLPQMPATPMVTDACGGCGYCARQCPTQAIPAGNPRTTDASRCILCMRCVSICPRKARILPPPLLEGMTARLQLCASEPRLPELYV